MRTLALDVSKNFSEVAVHEEGQVRRRGRTETRDIRAFAASPEPTDHVVPRVDGGLVGDRRSAGEARRSGHDL